MLCLNWGNYCVEVLFARNVGNFLRFVCVPRLKRVRRAFSSICQVPMKSYFRVEEKCFKISITLNGEPVHCRHKIRFKTIFSTFLKDHNFVFFRVNT